MDKESKKRAGMLAKNRKTGTPGAAIEMAGGALFAVLIFPAHPALNRESAAGRGSPVLVQ